MKYKKDEVIEIAQIAAIMADEGRLDKLYNKTQEGYIATTHLMAKWALEFYKLNVDTDWEELLDSEGCWDDIIAKYTELKINNEI